MTLIFQGKESQKMVSNVEMEALAAFSGQAKDSSKLGSRKWDPAISTKSCSLKKKKKKDMPHVFWKPLASGSLD